MVNGDADVEGLGAVDAGNLELLEGEAAACSNADVVADGGASDGRAKEFGGSLKKNTKERNGRGDSALAEFES